jgi:hypothetical protein
MPGSERGLPTAFVRFFQGLSDARICLAGMHSLCCPQLPHPKRNARDGTPRVEKVLPQGAQAHGSQRIKEKVKRQKEKHAESDLRGDRCLVSFAFILLPFSFARRRGVAQLAEQRSPKPQVERSSRSAPVPAAARRIVVVDRERR